MSAAILNGGPATLVYGGIIAAVGSIATAASLGEMASMDPNVGAQYRWSALFARKYKAFWALIQGMPSSSGSLLLSTRYLIESRLGYRICLDYFVLIRNGRNRHGCPGNHSLLESRL